MIKIEAQRAACVAGAFAVLRMLRIKIEAQFGELARSFQSVRVSGNIAALALDCNKDLAPLQGFALAVLQGTAVAGLWPEEVKDFVQFPLPLEIGGEIIVDVLEHRWTGDLLARMDCGFKAETMERCMNSARQRARF